ncbi:hypothetical protein [Marinobacter subterrani]|uniref:hypothetical protein n=1 Tax=Marinobacter subterrani TaxID=1658765 RepID=UPI002354D89F|nr:hypothetical protein [Marinobacter subterrani]
MIFLRRKISQQAVTFLICLSLSGVVYPYTKSEMIEYFERKIENDEPPRKPLKEVYADGLVSGFKRHFLMKGIICSDVKAQDLIPRIKKFKTTSFESAVYFAMIFDKHCDSEIDEQRSFFEEKIVPLFKGRNSK